MKKNRIKFAGPSKKMAEALEAEGLYITWPKKVEGNEDLAIEGTFTTGCDWEKCVLIDLRDYKDLSTHELVDWAIRVQLEEAYEAFDLDEEISLNMEGTAAERKARGVPDAARLIEDKQEQETRLKRFAEVAIAVCEGKPIPPEDGEDADITLTADEVRTLLHALDYALPTIKRNPHKRELAYEVEGILNKFKEGLTNGK